MFGLNQLFCNQYFLFNCTPNRVYVGKVALLKYKKEESSLNEGFLLVKLFVQQNIKLFSFVALRPNTGHDYLILEVSTSHITTHHILQASSGRLISSSQRPLPDNTHNTHNLQTSTHTAGFEPAIPACEGPQTHSLDREATWTSK